MNGNSAFWAIVHVFPDFSDPRLFVQEQKHHHWFSPGSASSHRGSQRSGRGGGPEPRGNLWIIPTYCGALKTQTNSPSNTSSLFPGKHLGLTRLDLSEAVNPPRAVLIHHSQPNVETVISGNSSTPVDLPGPGATKGCSTPSQAAIRLLPKPPPSPSQSFSQLSRHGGADGGEGGAPPLCPRLVPTPASITAGALIGLLFCHANYSKLEERPPRGLNDRESIEGGVGVGGDHGAGWHLNSLFNEQHRQLYRPFRFPAGLFFPVVSLPEWCHRSTKGRGGAFPSEHALTWAKVKQQQRLGSRRHLEKTLPHQKVDEAGKF